MKKYLIAGLMMLHAALPAEQQYIRPPNNKEYKIEMVRPAVFDAKQDQEIREFFFENGYVVVSGVANKSDRDALVGLIDELIASDIPNSRRLGFLDLYHDETLANIRQDERMHRVFSNILGTEKLWVVFDRVIFQRTDEYEDPLPPHVDQNPITHPDFSNLQGMLALKDMDETTGTLAVIPQSWKFFQEYAQWTKPKDGYVEYQGDLQPSFIGLEVKEGELIIWDSRTTHSRFRGTPENDRYAALISFTNAKNNPELVQLRIDHFLKGTGSNNHDAGLRATASPRCQESLRKNPEHLTELGEKLYGLKLWEE